MSESTMEVIHVSWAKIYRYKSITFEWHFWCGPMFLRRKDLEPKSLPHHVPNRYWGELSQWQRLSEAERENYRIF